MFESVLWGVVMFAFYGWAWTLALVPTVLTMGVAVALALVIDAAVAPRARLAAASAEDVPRASIGHAHGTVTLARLLVVPGAVLSAIALVVHADGVVAVLPTAALLLIARAAHAPDAGARAAAAAAMRVLGVVLIVLVAVFALVAGPFALMPLAIAAAVYVAGRQRDDGETAIATVLLAMVVTPVVLGYAEGHEGFLTTEMAAVPLGMLLLGGIAWRIEHALRALPRLTPRTLPR